MAGEVALTPITLEITAKAKVTGISEELTVRRVHPPTLREG